MTLDQILAKFLKTNPENRDGLISTLLVQLDDELSAKMQVMAMLSGYFLERGAAGCGDGGHRLGLNTAARKQTAIRKVLGFTNP